jgi:Xaa-Pro aminopeptidase
MMPSKTIPATYRRRLAALRKRIDEAGVDGLLVSYPADQFYLTGAVLEDSAVLVATGSRRVVIVTDSRFDEQVAQQSPWVSKLLRTESLVGAIVETAADLHIARLGMDEHMSLGQFDMLSKKVGTGKPHLKMTRGLVLTGRAIKDDDEIATIIKAIRVAERGYLATLPMIQPGVAEQDVAAELEYQMRKAGGAGVAFEPIVASGKRGSLPHARASSVKVRANQPLLIDWGARVGGYCSDLTRVRRIGTIPPAIREIYPIVAEAQLAGIAAIKPGVTGRVVDRAAREIIEKAGFGPQFGHGLGHGVGLDVHEQPAFSSRSEDVLKPGMVITVEPGIYLPGVGGVRIEDDVLVTETGNRVLSKLPKTA